MAAEYTVHERATDEAGRLDVAAPGDCIAVSAPAAAVAEISLDGGPWIPAVAFPLMRSTCRAFERVSVRWSASADGTLYVFTGRDFDIGMMPG